MDPKEDLFGRQARSYAEYRPSYPEELYKFILKFCDFSERPKQALDVATGSGQAAIALAEQFEKVIAIDSSIEQLKEAKARNNIEYKKGLAENTGVASKSVDLVTVAQALHWFDFAKFFTECSRVLKPGGTLAVWGYGLPRVQGNEKATSLINDFGTSKNRLGPYWAPERRYIVEEYESISPDSKEFHKLIRHKLVSTSKWNINALVGYLSSWSPYSTWRHRHPEREDPLIAFKAEILEACNAADGSFGLVIEFPIFLFMAKRK